jgi:DHA2 family multidrug resistance protein
MSAAFASSATIDRHRAITLAALMATYMEAVNISLPNAALPHIQGALSMADDEVGWVFTAYIAAGATVMPVARWLAGRYGRKTIYQLSLAVFSLGVILDTLATSPIQFVFARIVQGAASGTLAPLSLAILLDMLPDFLFQPADNRLHLPDNGTVTPREASRAEGALRLLRPGDLFARHDRPADAA